MHFFTSIALLLGAAAAFQSPHNRAVKRSPEAPPVHQQQARSVRGSYNSSYLNPKSHSMDLLSEAIKIPGDKCVLSTLEFLVNGSAIPEVDFDIGESFAGTLPNTPAGNSSLWFWFFPSENPKASDEITIWLNGGPGCSSLDGLLQENGPFLWQSGTYRPIRNPYSWTNLTNVVYVDQPAGTGFSPGPSTVNNEVDVANQFNSFWKNFVDTFNLHGRKVYITGESYAGMYVPYIAAGMLDKNDTKYYNVKGIQINDPSINYDDTMIEAPAVPALNYFKSVLPLNDSFMAEINEQAEKCGYFEFLEKALVYPPTGKLPTAPDSSQPGCDVWDAIYAALLDINPCFNIYHLTDFCPYLWDVMGFPSLAGGPNDYFNRSDVQAVLHAPPTDYSVCDESIIFANGDSSVPSALGPLPSVIERTNNTIIGHGWLDYLLFMNGTLATIQNMTWNGAQGFQKPPIEPLYVPYHWGLAELYEGTATAPFTQDAGAGYLGTAHTERGLTFTSVYLAGHEIPQYAPGAAYRHLEFLLGRIGNLSEQTGYTTQ